MLNHKRPSSQTITRLYFVVEELQTIMLRTSAYRCAYCIRTRRNYSAVPQSNAPSASVSASSSAQPLSTPMTPAASKRTLLEKRGEFSMLTIDRRATEERQGSQEQLRSWNSHEGAQHHEGWKRSRSTTRIGVSSIPVEDPGPNEYRREERSTQNESSTNQTEELLFRKIVGQPCSFLFTTTVHTT